MKKFIKKIPVIGDLLLRIKKQIKNKIKDNRRKKFKIKRRKKLLHASGKYLGIYHAFEFINKYQHTKPGDYLEFGVYKGRSFIEAYKKSKEMKFDKMRFFAFDSFEGLPELGKNDASFDQFHEGQYSYSEKDFLNTIKQDSVDLERVITVPGFYGKSLKEKGLKEKLGIKFASVIWVDCDLYVSTKPVLEFITDIIDTGTIIVFDDWFSFAGDLYKGEIRAVNEWLEMNPDIRLCHYKDIGKDGRIFIVQKVID